LFGPNQEFINQQLAEFTKFRLFQEKATQGKFFLLNLDQKFLNLSRFFTFFQFLIKENMVIVGCARCLSN
jgi:hypothetical protein